MNLEERITRLENIEAIRYLQAKYQRCLDCRDFDGLAECFDIDATACYDSGKMSYKGKEQIIEFLSKVMKFSRPSTHLIHGGEIDIDDEFNARAKRILEDKLLIQEAFVKIYGAAVYKIDYIKKDEKWFIKNIGYTRYYQYVEHRGIFNLFSLCKKDVFKELKNKDFNELGEYGRNFQRKRFKKESK